MPSSDPTTTAIEEQNAERDRLRAEVDRLAKALVEAYTAIEVKAAECDRLRKIADAADAVFTKGYDQAVAEIRDHFAKTDDREVVAEIEKIWKIALARTAKTAP